jgi:hypothetical protein
MNPRCAPRGNSLADHPRAERRRRVSPALGLALLVASVVVIAGSGCGSSSDTADQLAQQNALRQARQDGARNARQNEKIRQLQREVRQQDQAADSSVPSAAPTAVSSYVPAYGPYQPSDPSYGYAAEVPTGGGWSAPIESHPTSGALLRTSWRGPDGTLLIIDRTPQDVPDLGGSYDVARTVPQPNFGQATEYIFSRSAALPDCNGRPCADFLINDGSGGGWGVLAGGPSLPVAESIASHVAESISFGD